MSRSPAKSRKAMAMKSLKEKRDRSVQSARENGEKDIGDSSTITHMSHGPHLMQPASEPAGEQPR